MNKKTLFLIFAIVSILGTVFFVYSRNSAPANQQKISEIGENSMIFFYGTGCSHCANVEKFLEGNKSVEEKLKFLKLDIWSNKKYSDIMTEKAKKCGISTETLGVPFFWDGSECIVGDVNIIDYFKKQINQEQ